MSVMVLDSGNSLIKAKIARRESGEVAFPHALRPLTENGYSNILARASVSGLSPDVVRGNGKLYVVGESAERHGLVTAVSLIFIKSSRPQHCLASRKLNSDLKAQAAVFFHD